MQGTWIAISPTRAQTHPLYGVRGWLIAVLWLNTLPVALAGASVVGLLWLHGNQRPIALMPFVWLLLWMALPLGLVAVAFMRLRWFPVVLFVFGLLQLLVSGVQLAGSRAWFAQAVASSSLAMLALPLLLLPFVTMAYALRSRRVRVTYRHEVRANDSAAAPAVFDRPSPGETPTDATEHARERAALRRVAQELTSGMLDTETWMQVMRHHASAPDSVRTAAYVRARMAVLCPPAHAQPRVAHTLKTGFGALLISVAATAALVFVVTALARWVPRGTARVVEALALAGLLLSWLGGLLLGARFLQRAA